MNDETVARLGDELYQTLRSNSVLAPLSGREPAIIILSGSAVPLEPVRAGDEMRCEAQGMGGVHCGFV